MRFLAGAALALACPAPPSISREADPDADAAAGGQRVDVMIRIVAQKMGEDRASRS